MADRAGFNWDAVRNHPLARRAAGRLPESVRQSPAKSAVLAALVIVMAGAWARTLLRSPAGARAAAAVSGQLANAVGGGAGASSASVRSAGAGGRRHEALVAWLRAPAGPSARNAFAVRPEDYPVAVAVAEPAVKPAAPAGPGPWDELAKSLARRADEQARRESAAAEFRKVAAGLVLSTTVMTRPPTAILDGRAVREGQTVPAAGGPVRVLRIEPRRVTVGRGEWTAEVRFAGDKPETGAAPE